MIWLHDAPAVRKRNVTATKSLLGAHLWLKNLRVHSRAFAVKIAVHGRLC